MNSSKNVRFVRVSQGEVTGTESHSVRERPSHRLRPQSRPGKTSARGKRLRVWDLKSGRPLWPQLNRNMKLALLICHCPFPCPFTCHVAF